MIVVHHLERSRSQRVLWLLEELGVPYRVERYARDPDTLLAPPELRRVHPLGKSPVIVDGDTVVAESGAIIEYLLERYDSAGALRPAPGTPALLRYRYWLHYAEGSAMPPLLMALVFGRLPQGPMPFFVRPIVRKVADTVRRRWLGPQLKLHFDFIEQELTRHEWFAGDAFGGADVQMSFPLEAGAARGALGEAHPRARAWLERIHARPAWRRALEQGGPYELLGEAG